MMSVASIGTGCGRGAMLNGGLGCEEVRVRGYEYDT